MRVLRFPHSKPDESVDNEPITEERIGLANAIGEGLRAWIADHPHTTRDDIRWALDVAASCVVDGQSERNDDE